MKYKQAINIKEFNNFELERNKALQSMANKVITLNGIDTVGVFGIGEAMKLDRI